MKEGSFVPYHLLATDILEFLGNLVARSSYLSPTSTLESLSLQLTSERHRSLIRPSDIRLCAQVSAPGIFD